MSGQWDELERLAKALGGTQDWRLITDTDDAKRIGPYVVRQSVGAVAAVPRESPITSGARFYMAFIAAANPAAILELITAARAGSVGTNGEAGREQKPSDGTVVAELVEALRRAEPMLETLHSVVIAPDVRKSVWSVIKAVRAALSRTEAQTAPVGEGGPSAQEADTQRGKSDSGSSDGGA